MRSFSLKALFLLQLITFGQAKEISIQETVEFLQSKLDVYHTSNHYGDNGKKSFSYKVSQSFIANGNCNFIIRQENIGYKKKLDILGEARLWKEEYIFDAKDLDPTKVYFNKGDSFVSEVWMESTEHKNNIQHITYWYEPLKKRNYCDKESLEEGESIKIINSKECSRNYPTSVAKVFRILTPIDDNRPRVIKAMKHLIEMCGGKEELF